MLFTFSAIFLDVLLLDIVFFFYRLSYFYKNWGMGGRRGFAFVAEERDLRANMSPQSNVTLPSSFRGFIYLCL